MAFGSEIFLDGIVRMTRRATIRWGGEAMRLTPDLNNFWSLLREFFYNDSIPAAGPVIPFDGVPLWSGRPANRGINRDFHG
jgi:hypothetical protein